MKKAIITFLVVIAWGCATTERDETKRQSDRNSSSEGVFGNWTSKCDIKSDEKGSYSTRTMLNLSKTSIKSSLTSFSDDSCAEDFVTVTMIFNVKDYDAQKQAFYSLRAKGFEVTVLSKRALNFYNQSQICGKTWKKNKPVFFSEDCFDVQDMPEDIIDEMTYSIEGSRIDIRNSNDSDVEVFFRK